MSPVLCVLDLLINIHLILQSFYTLLAIVGLSAQIALAMNYEYFEAPGGVGNRAECEKHFNDRRGLVGSSSGPIFTAPGKVGAINYYLKIWESLLVFFSNT